MKRHILYVRNKCIGCGFCAQTAPDIWHMNPHDGKADIFDGSFKKDSYFRMLWPDEQNTVQQAEKFCPTKAIKII